MRKGIHRSLSRRRRRSRRVSQQPPQRLFRGRQVVKAQPKRVTLVDATRELLPNQMASISERRERSLLKAYGGDGLLAKIHDGKKRGAVVTIHGINGSPDTVEPLSLDSAAQGKDVYSFVYQDRKNRLGKNSADLARGLRDLQKQHPGQELTLRAHSMAARFTVDALRQLDEQGDLKVPVHLELTSPTLGGFERTNSLSRMPKMLEFLPYVGPGKDMGPNSAFQTRLEATQLPPQVRTTTLIGSKEDSVKPKSRGFRAVHDGLNGQIRYVDGAKHTDILKRITGSI